MKKRKFGLLSDGRKVSLYTVDNGKMMFSVTDYGCIITSLMLPNKNGTYSDIVEGYSTFDGYVNSPGGFFGAIVGRFANRIGGAKFSVNSETYKLDDNDNGNCLHGGFLSYNKVLWHSEKIEAKNSAGVRFTRLSPDGEQGFPGNVNLEVIYLLNDKNEISMKYRAVTDKKTPINMTNHSYFNLKGEGNGDILSHEVKLLCDYYVEPDSKLIPTGKLLQVNNTPFDFRVSKPIGRDIKKAGGYDHCFCINGNENSSSASCSGNIQKFAEVYEPETGRRMTVSTNQPGVQFYTGNFLGGLYGKTGRPLKEHEAFCLETQQFPDAPNKQQFPDSFISPGDRYEAVSIYKFEF